MLIRKKFIASALCVALTAELAACGTLLYPERRGQRSGTIDPAIAILNGVGILLFVIPGLVAFAIDFATGAIYLPGGRRASLDGGPMTTVYVDQLDRATIERVVGFHTGAPVDLSDARWLVRETDVFQAGQQLAMLSPSE